MCKIQCHILICSFAPKLFTLTHLKINIIMRVFANINSFVHILVLILFNFIIFFGGASASDELIIETNSGRLGGVPSITREGAVYHAFRGIRYGKIVERFEVQFYNVYFQNRFYA